MTVTVICGHRRVPPFAVDGGEPGKVGCEWVERTDGSVVTVQGIDAVNVSPGDVFVMETPGGGGFGHYKD